MSSLAARRPRRPGQRGQGMGEYTLVAAGIAIVIITLFSVVGRRTSSSFCQVSAGLTNSTATYGTGVSWGQDSAGTGVLGNGTAGSIATPTTMPEPNACVKEIAAGQWHGATLTVDGTVYAFGLNNMGQLGQPVPSPANTANPRPKVVPGLSNVTQITVGEGDTYALKGDGTVWAFGTNLYGALGNNTGPDPPASPGAHPTPVQVVAGACTCEGTGFLTKVTQIAAGDYNACALRSDGTEWCWGSNAWGELGVGGCADTLAPVQVTLVTGITQIANGYIDNYALKSDGTVWTWGWNGWAQMGNNGFAGVTCNSNGPQQQTPVQLWAGGCSCGPTGYMTNVTQIAEGLALRSDGSLWAWGSNQYGQYGIGSADGGAPNLAHVVPFQVLAGGCTQCGGPYFNGVQSIGNGAYLDVATRTDGTLWVWGMGASGVAGAGAFAPATINSPTQVTTFQGSRRAATAQHNSAAYAVYIITNQAVS